MDQSNEEYGRCIKCKQISTSLICQACNSNLKEREYGKCISCKQIKPINKEANYCHTCSSIYREKKYGKCAECKQINSGKNWCHTCDSNKFQQNFNNWTTGSDDVDKFIQNNQLSARSHYQLLEWIPYDRFSEIVYIAKGGFGKIYRAYWKDGYISHWDATKHQWRRNSPNKYVAFKILDRSQNLT
ncbi:hypothetical protein C1646_306305 [Rhizophagus diaphanus]|nr:hypothetical protein C1646_306305 [Rhizophagus diaphanus] [Rhizophagus sp. MUCL 43196]